MTKASRVDKERIIEILSGAFDDNKSVNYIIKQDAKRDQRIKNLMAYAFEMSLAYGEIFISDDKNACALILIPERKRTSLKSILLDVKLILYSTGINNIKKVLSRETAIQKIHTDEKAFYLWFVGVDVNNQGNGLGSGLLNYIIKVAENQNRSVFLETSTTKNLPWYEKFGFKIYKELDFGYKLFCLKRG